MAKLEKLGAADLRGLLKPKVLRRARGYVRRLQDLERWGETLTAKVEGSGAYQVEVTAGTDGIVAHCSCPYDWGGYCKHIGAVLLRWIESPHDFAIRDSAPGSATMAGLAVEAMEPSPTQRPKNLPAWVAMPFPERQRAYVAQLEEHLGAVKLNDLREMGRHRGWPLRGTRKDVVVGQVAGYIADREGIGRAMEELDGEHRQVLRALFLLSGQPMNWPSELERVVRAWGPLRAHKQIGTYARHLWQEGLALPGYAAGSAFEMGAVIPWSLARHFPPLLSDLAAEGPGATAASGLRLADPYDLARSASQVALMLEQSPVRLRTPMPRPHLETFYPELAGWDYVPEELAGAQRQGKLNRQSDLVLTVPPPRHPLPDEAVEWLAPLTGGESRLAFVYALLVAAGLLQPGSPTTVWPEVKAQFLQRDDLGRRAVLARTYFGMENWSALWEVVRTSKDLQLERVWQYGSRGAASLRSDLVRFRNLVLSVLAALPDGRWVAIEDLLGVLQILFPVFEQSALEPYRYLYSGRLATKHGDWFVTRNGRPLRSEDGADWDAAQGAFARYILSGPLQWLGLTDLQVEGDRLLAFRLHGLADLYEDRVDVAPAPDHAAGREAEPASAEAVAIDALRIIVDPARVSAQAHNLLDRIARLDVAEADRFVYRLDAQAVYESFEEGMALADILDGWEETLSLPMPNTVRAQLEEWWQAYGRVRIYEGLTVVEFGDEYALAEMKAVTSLAAHVVAEISPRLVIIRREALESLVAELEHAGYTPKQTEELGECQAEQAPDRRQEEV
jgi:hypothetical protein